MDELSDRPLVGPSTPSAVLLLLLLLRLLAKGNEEDQDGDVEEEEDEEEDDGCDTPTTPVCSVLRGYCHARAAGSEVARCHHRTQLCCDGQGCHGRNGECNVASGQHGCDVGEHDDGHSD